MSATEDLEEFEAEIELQLYKEYRDVLPMFRHVVETDRRFYLANEVKVITQQATAKLTNAVARRLSAVAIT